MRRFTKGIELVESQMKEFEASRMNMLQGHAAIADGGLKDLKELTAGTLSKSQTRGAFARGASPAANVPGATRRRLTKRQLGNRNLKGQVPLLPINMQTRKLHDAASLEKLPSGGAIQRFGLGFAGVDYAKWITAVGGTSKMISRGLQAEVMRRWKARNAAFVNYFVRKQRS